MFSGPQDGIEMGPQDGVEIGQGTVMLEENSIRTP